jgi:hypothetical protein
MLRPGDARRKIVVENGVNVNGTFPGPVTDCASRKNAGLELMLGWLGGFAAQVNRQRLGDCAGDRNAPTGNRVFLAALFLLLAR